MTLMEILIIVAIILVIVMMVWNASIKQDYEIRVSKRDTVIKTDSEGESTTVRYIYSKNLTSRKSATFTCNDSMLDGVYNSADLYGELEEGSCFHIKTRGLRDPRMSMFPNIYYVEEIKCP